MKTVKLLELKFTQKQVVFPVDGQGHGCDTPSPKGEPKTSSSTPVDLYVKTAMSFVALLARKKFSALVYGHVTRLTPRPIVLDKFKLAGFVIGSKGRYRGRSKIDVKRSLFVASNASSFTP